MRNKRKQTNGITLIALVITIIVLLILAGISIATLTGENGVLTKANTAKEQTIIGQEKEAISLAYTACKTKDYTKNVEVTEMQEEIDKIRENAQVSGTLEDLNIYFKDTKHRYKLKQDGKIEQQTDVTPEEANKIVNMLGPKVGVTAGGEVIYIESDLVANKYTILNTENRTTITEEGVKKAVENCFVDNAGKVYTWGRNSSGQVGDGTKEDRSSPICISDLENALKGKTIVDIDSDGYSTIALDNAGKVYAWGSNDHGKLGDGTYEGRSSPICISDLENDLKGKTIVDINSSFDAYSVLDNAGKVYAWGYNDHGELGDGTYEGRSSPICISDLENDLKGKTIVDIDSNRSITVALDNAGKVYAWGYNYSGQVGDGTKENRSLPICISDLENDLKGKTIVDIDTDGSITVALDNAGKVYAWGANYVGQVGDGTKEDRSLPICISDLENDLKGKTIVDINTNGSTTIALDNAGKVYAWGANYVGQVGDGTKEDRSSPICLSDLENDLRGKTIVNIDMDMYDEEGMVVAQDNAGKVYTWGSNDHGKLGDGTKEDRSSPICLTNMEGSLLYNKVINKTVIIEERK